MQALIAQSNGIPQLIELLSTGSHATQAAAARLLWHLAGNEAAGGAISAAGGMQPLCDMLASEDVHAQELAATVRVVVVVERPLERMPTLRHSRLTD